jgi:hypothetical protein
MSTTVEIVDGPTVVVETTRTVEVTVGLRGPAGADGADGTDGADGADGSNGVGVPVGGTTGQVLTKQSATDYDTDWETPSGATAKDEYVVFTANGSFTKATYSNARCFEVICQGPGGSGATADYSAGNGGGGGGAGGQAIKVFEPADLAASITVTINSTKAEFTHTTPVVGNAGSNGSGHTGGTGGSATGGDLNFAGARGEDGGDSSNSTATHGGNGGAPLGLYRLGAGGYRGDTTNVANSPDLDGNNGQGYGGGGGGGSCNSSASGNGSGGSGAAGYVIVKVKY